MRRLLMTGAAAAAVFGALVPASASAASPEELEARLRALEAALADVRAELASARAENQAQAQRVVVLEEVAARPAPPPPPAAAPAAPADGFRLGAHTVRYGGFVKLDAIVSDFDGGDPANGDLVREFLLPGSIPVGGTAEGAETHFNARQTRFWLTTEGDVAGHKVGTRVEMDFQALPGSGDSRTTNPSNPALRRAYVTVDDWLFGQDWSTFQNPAVLPETADYIGPSEGTVFVRQPQIRYSKNGFSIALENPETTATPFNGGSRIVADDNGLPDLTARWAKSGPMGDISIAGLVRRLSYDNGGAIDGEATGYGVSLSGRLKVGAKDDLRFMLTGGEGIGRYVGVNFANDAVVTSTGDLEPIGVVAGFAAYKHYWSDQLRSTFIYSAQEVDNPAFAGASANRSAQSLHLNLVYSPVRGLDLGAEIMTGERELESGASGELTRFHAFAKYGF